MKSRWTIINNTDSDILKNAADLLYRTVSALVGGDLTVVSSDGVETPDKAGDHILVGRSGDAFLRGYEAAGRLAVPQEAEGYAIYVGKSLSGEGQTVCIAGRGDSGVLYGCAEFCGKYCGDILYRGCDIWRDDIFDAPFERPLPEWNVSRFPAVKTRAVWTWGHVIYDYRRFFTNMARLRLNEIVIWNDLAPKNADAVVDFAHSLGIRVIWGFSWGWSTSCREDFDNLSADRLEALKNEIISRYEKEYAGIKGDGIYFQSFTEFGADGEKGRRLAETVTKLVNDTACALLERYQGLHIQFGLHATSVKAHLDVISKVDPRIYIVWEDCGAFPYNYDPENVDSFDETEELTGKLLSLRGENERFGAVLKGMLKLDWTRFRHLDESIEIGEQNDDFIQKRQIRKNRIWKIIQAGWLKNAGCAGRIISLIAGGRGEPVVEALIEDALLENRIMFPAALYAELLWTPDADVYELTETVSKYPFVCFANTDNK